MAKTHGLNFWVSPEIIDIGSVYLENVLLVDALQFIVERYNLTYSKEGNIISFFQTKPVPIEIPTYVNCVDGKLTINVKDLLLNEFINMIIDSCGCNVVLEQGTSGVITGYLRDADFEQGLIAVLDANNLNLRRDENIYYISSYAAQERKVKRAFGINVDKNKVSLNVANVDLRSLIEDLASKLGLDIFIYGNIAGTVTASVKDLSSKNVFDYILNDTNYTYRVVDNVYFFGSSTLPEVNKSSLIKLENMKAENIIELILSWFSANWTFLV
ncbi:MAG: hypothetical protein J7K40_10565 [candidate division Zixibacteria bacterium]|nr:hypothetical protein [candidate division Zixibacteria bacterium]